jgi:hypothetical protein
MFVLTQGWIVAYFHCRSGHRATAAKTTYETSAPIAAAAGEAGGGLRTHSGQGGRTLAQLRNEASQRGEPGRSRMNKVQLEVALKR